MAGNGGYQDVMEVAWAGCGGGQSRDVMEVAWASRGGGQSQGGAWVCADDAQRTWGQAEGRRVERRAPKGGLWAAVRVR